MCRKRLVLYENGVFLRKNYGPHIVIVLNCEKLISTKPKKQVPFQNRHISHPMGAIVVLMVYFHENSIRQKISTEKCAIFYVRTMENREICHISRIYYYIFALLYKGSKGDNLCQGIKIWGKVVFVRIHRKLFIKVIKTVFLRRFYQF